jgi:sorting nexin-9/18/33
LLGGKSFNRFSAFVTSGAEAFVLNGASSEENASSSVTGSKEAPEIEGLPASSSHHSRFASDVSVVEPGASVIDGVTVGGEADKHFVEAGPAWKGKVPPFRVLVHSPVKQTSPLSGSYIVYSVTSLFEKTPSDSGDDVDDEGTANQEDNATRITVHRRFSHFVAMHTALTRRLPGLALPPLPEKQYAGRFSNDFVEARRGDLERYLSRLVRHPVVRYAEVLTFFLSCENDMVR